MNSVLFVCTANISRSPYAERRARQLASRGQFASAGVPGSRDHEMDPAMVTELLARGGDPSGHRSRPVTAELLEQHDLVLCVEFGHRIRLLQDHGQYAAKIFGLRQFAAAVENLAPSVPAPNSVDDAGVLAAIRAQLRADSMTNDIADPWQRGPAAAARCADEIDGLLASILPVLTGSDRR